MIRSTTFRIMVMAERGNGTKLESTIPRPEILLTEVWLGTRKIDCRCNNSNSCCQDQDFQQNLSILQLFFMLILRILFLWMGRSLPYINGILKICKPFPGIIPTYLCIVVAFPSAFYNTYPFYCFFSFYATINLTLSCNVIRRTT